MYMNTDLLVLVATILVIFVAIGLILTRLYKRASKETSFVRTGFGGQRVVMDGGALVLPVLHETIPVNMNTLRLMVRRDSEQALITRDRMRVDVVAEFYVRVKPTKESIAFAAQTLGRRTMKPEQLKDLVEGKFVDALRSVAAEMSMEELHEKRVDFVQKVQTVVTEDLLKNGLELETVSLTGLDQTSREYFNPDNAFDAEGLTRLTEEIEQRRKIRNDIEQNTKVQIRTRDLEAERQILEISREEEYARLAQEREVEVRRAKQMAEIAQEQAERGREAEQARIKATQEVQQSEIASERAVEEEKIERDRVVREKEIQKEQIIELARQVKEIAIAEKSRDESVARSEADKARALAVSAEEQVKTTREKEIAERQKQIELIQAAQIAEKEAISIKIAAEAEKLAAADKAAAVRENAQGFADELRIQAKAEAEAEELRAAAAKVRYDVDAAGQLAINEAANILNNDQIDLQYKLALIENLQDIIRESVKPMEKIDGIKIYQVSGLNGGSSSASTEGGDGNASSLSDQLVNAALKYRTQAPLLDGLMEDIGLNGGDLNGLVDTIKVKKD